MFKKKTGRKPNRNDYGRYLYECESVDLHVAGALFLTQAELDAGNDGGYVGGQRSRQHQDQLTRESELAKITALYSSQMTL